uniref:Uncharacterized protein n=1 Tax=Strongyloides venezuelensis TaxID=75913 RepID=A0A0K0FVH6_STRVS
MKKKTETFVHVSKWMLCRNNERINIETFISKLCEPCDDVFPTLPGILLKKSIINVEARPSFGGPQYNKENDRLDDIIQYYLIKLI